MPMIVSLCGFMGCGKSSVGKRIAAMLDCRFIDLDKYIEDKTQRKITEIFRTDGEDFFREKEYEALCELVTGYGRYDGGMTILSLGGGTPTYEKCREIIRIKTLCIYLKAGDDTLAHNLERDWKDRPVLSKSFNKGKDLKEITRSLMKERSPFYEECAEITVDTDGKSFDQVAEETYNIVTRLYEK